MPKIDRNRGMFFGSWTGQTIAESAVATVEVGEAITKVEVTAATFGTAVNGSAGEYRFVYSNTEWTLNGVGITTTAYGLTITGTPASGDTFTVTYHPANGGWEALGKDTDDLSKDLNPDVETGKNVLGEATFTHSGYEPQIDMDPYYMDPTRNMYAHLLECALEERYAETDLLGYFAEAFFTKVNEASKTMTGYCYVRRAWFVPQSVGGDTAGYNIPFSVSPVGAMVKKNISYDMVSNTATITNIEAGE